MRPQRQLFLCYFIDKLCLDWLIMWVGLCGLYKAGLSGSTWAELLGICGWLDEVGSGLSCSVALG